MEKTVKVEYQEQSKGVVANVKVEITGLATNINSDEVLAEATALFNKASVVSYQHTRDKK